MLNDVTLHGNLHTTTQAGGVSQATGARLDIGGASRFTAAGHTVPAQTTPQNAAISNAANRLVGTVTFDKIEPGSWADVSVTTTTALTLAPLQSGGAVTLDAQGAVTTQDTLNASGNLSINSHGGAVTLGVAIVSGDMTVVSGDGAVSQTGQLVVTGNTEVDAGTGQITLLNPFNVFGITPTSQPNTPPPVSPTLKLIGTETKVATSSDLNLKDVHNSGTMTLSAPHGAINLGLAFFTGGGLTLKSQNDLQLGSATITGYLTMESTAGAVSFGQATVKGTLTATTYNNPVDLGSANVDGSLIVTTNGGDVVQRTPNAALHVTGTSTINAGTGNVMLPNVPNQFVGVVSLQANNVELVASSNLVLGESTIKGTMDVTSVTGSITQDAPITVRRASSFTAHTDVVLDKANTFTQAVAVDAVNVSLAAASALKLDTSTVTGDFKVATALGDITQAGPIDVTGKSTITTSAGGVVLTDAANRFAGVVDAQTSAALSLTSAGPLTMGKVVAQGNADLQSTGVLNLGSGSYGAKLKANSGGSEIRQSGPIKFVGDTDFDAGNAKIDLFDPNNLWTGVLTFKGGIIMINHPVLMNAVSAATLVVRAETTIQTGLKTSGTSNVTSASSATGSAKTDISISTVRQANANQSGLITVGLSAEAAAPGRSFSIDMAEHIPTPASSNAEVKVTQMDGKSLPDWLKFDPATKSFVATNVPPGAFPLQLRVGVGATDAVILIQQNQDIK